MWIYVNAFSRKSMSRIESIRMWNLIFESKMWSSSHWCEEKFTKKKEEEKRKWAKIEPNQIEVFRLERAKWISFGAYTAELCHT